MPSFLRFLLAGLAALPTLVQAQPLPSARERAPRLVVLIAVDQLRPDYFSRWNRQLTGGLGRLWREGAAYPNGFHDHAITETAPGHATMMSGRLPRSTGIILNDEGVQDPQTPLLGSQADPASPYRFRGSVLFDWMRATDVRSRALSVSRKDRGAILPLGRAKQQVFWYAADFGFTTSRYYGDSLPAFVQEFNRRNPIAGFANQTWNLLLDEREYQEYDADSAEYDRKRVTFPHRLPAGQPELGKDLPYHPVMDSLTLALAWEGVRALQLGRGPALDFLNVSLSTTDAIGHRYGPDSRELHDQVLRVDRLIGAFMDSLRVLFPEEGVAIALTADHGVAPYPEVRRSYDPMPRGARFVNDSLMVSRVRAAIAARGAWRDAVRFDLGLLRIWRDSLAVKGIDADSLLRELVPSIRATPGIASVRSIADIMRADTTRDSLARRWLHSIGPGEPATHVATLRPWSSWSKSYYANHGSPHDYDRRVPIVFWGPWFRSGVRSERIRVVDIAPTLARVLRIPVLEQVDGRVVTSALR